MKNAVWALSAILFFIVGCASDNPKLKPKPMAYSKINEVTVVADKEIWNGPIGDSLRFYFSSPYLILPSPEPIFDLRYFPPIKIKEEPIFRTLRNYIFLADLSDENSLTTQMIKNDLGNEKSSTPEMVNTSVGKDKWAIGQNIFYLYSGSQDGLAKTIKKSFPTVKKRLQDIEAPRIKATAFQGGKNGGIDSKILEKFGAKVEIPKGYVVAIEDDNFLWLRRETKGISSSLLMTKVSYKDKTQLTPEGIRALRDSMGIYVASDEDRTKMVTNDVDLPMFSEKINLNNRYAVETHGIWEMENDFMGGPFVNMAIVNEEKGELFMADGFVFGPGEEKRNHMQYLDMILKTIKF